MSPAKAPTGLPLVDAIDGAASPTLQEYAAAASEYIRSASDLRAEPKKSAQIRLSGALGRAVLNNLQDLIPSIRGRAGEQLVAGGLRSVNLDVVEQHPLDGLRLAVEIKPVHLAVGRAIWNRFGDIRTVAVNLHLKFPFAVVGGLMTVPTYELTGSGNKKDTRPLITRATERFVRAGDRRTEAAAPHLLEAVGLVVFDPDSGEVSPDLPPRTSGLRYDDFLTELAAAYDARFED